GSPSASARPTRRVLDRHRAWLELLHPVYAAGLALRRLAGPDADMRALDPLHDDAPADDVPQPEPLIIGTSADASALTHALARYGLTPRETEVALLLARRLTTEEIARALGCAERTARHHTEQVMTKLGVASRRAVADALDPRP